MRAGIGIGGVDVNVLDGHAQRLGADLPRHRFHPLAEIDRGQRNGELAAGVGMNQRLAWITAEIHPDRIIDGSDAPPAMFGHDQRLLVPKTEEKRAAPWVDPAGGGAGTGALRGGGSGGAVRAGAAGVGRS